MATIYCDLFLDAKRRVKVPAGLAEVYLDGMQRLGLQMQLINSGMSEAEAIDEFNCIMNSLDEENF